MTLFIAFTAAAFGLVFGSFLNVCIYRLPREKSIVWPASFCPNCSTPIKPYDNIPIIGFLLLGGKCRACKAPISWRYPVIEGIAGALTVLYTLRHYEHLAWLPVVLAAVYALLVLAVIDIDFMIIPDELSLGLLGLGLAASWLNPAFSGSGWRHLLSSAVGAGVGFFLVWGMAVAGEWVFKKEAMGGGDVKLMAGIGALLGWQGAICTLLLGSLFGSVYGIALMISKRAGRSQPIPFGPFLALGAAINLYIPIPLTAFLIG